MTLISCLFFHTQTCTKGQTDRHAGIPNSAHSRGGRPISERKNSVRTVQEMVESELTAFC